MIAALLVGAMGLTAGILLLKRHPMGLNFGWIALALVAVACVIALLQLPELRQQMTLELQKQSARDPNINTVAPMVSTAIVVGVIIVVILRIGLNVVYALVLRNITAKWKKAQLLSPRTAQRS